MIRIEQGNYCLEIQEETRFTQRLGEVLRQHGTPDDDGPVTVEVPDGELSVFPPENLIQLLGLSPEEVDGDFDAVVFRALSEIYVAPMAAEPKTRNDRPQASQAATPRSRNDELPSNVRRVGEPRPAPQKPAGVFSGQALHRSRVQARMRSVQRGEEN